MAKWQSICMLCRKGGPCTTRSDEKYPSINPPMINGKCPVSGDKHSPTWIRIQ